MSFFSPSDDGEERLTDTFGRDRMLSIPVPRFGRLQSRIQVDFENVTDPSGKRVQTPRRITPVDQWTKDDVEQLRYLGTLMWIKEANTPDLRVEDFAVDPTDWAPGLRTLAEYCITGGYLTPWAQDLIETAIEMDLPDDVIPAEPMDFPGARLDDHAVGDGETPTWVRFTSARGKWLTSERIKGKFAKEMVGKIISGQGNTKGYCSLIAMLASGVPYGKIKNKPLAFWKDIKVGDLTDFMDSINEPYKLYDAAGRLIRSKGDGRHFMVAAGHITAFIPGVRTSPPFELFEKKSDETLEWCAKTWPFRGTNTLEVDLFYMNSGIRAPRYTGTTYGNIDFDQHKAYPSALLNPDYVFPVPSDYNYVDEFGSKQISRDEVYRHHFYLVDLEFATLEERHILAGSRQIAWLYGDVMLRSFNVPSFTIRGVFEMDGLKPGIAVPGDELEKYGGIRALIPFTGCLEKITSTVESDSFKSNPEELATLEQQGLHKMDYELCNFGNTATFRRTRHWKTTGRMAKLAMYQYTAGSLLKVWNEVRAVDPAAMLCSIRTDCIGVRARVTADQIASVGTEPGEFKVEKEREGDQCSRAESGNYAIPSMRLRESRVTTLESVISDLELGILPRVALLGPPGCGKTHTYLNTIKPMLDAKGIDIKMATPLLTHVERMLARDIECETNAGFVASYDFAMIRQRMRKSILVIDEIGLATAHHFAAIQYIKPGGIILLGDHRQLSKAGDLLRIIRRLEVDTVFMQPHDSDRFSGDKNMRAVLQILEDAIDEQYNAGLHNRGGPGWWVGSLEKKLQAAGLQFVDRKPDIPDIRTLGWRHKVIDPLGGETVHSTQGDTITTPIYIADYKCDPRLLYTAISRAPKLSDVYALNAS